MTFLDPQLVWVKDLLDNCLVTYWIDSGTLLGLKREGRLLEWDNDIDIGVWREDIGKITNRRRSIIKEGYRFRIFRYSGEIFKIKLSPKSGAHKRDIDINVFRRSGDHAWCPQPIPRPGLKEVASIRKTGLLGDRPFTPIEALLDRFLLMWYKRMMRDVSIDQFPWSRLRVVWTWWIPGRFYEKVVTEQKHNLSVPNDWADYLEFRYGDWRIPKQNWSFIADDRGLVDTNPETLMK